MANFFLRKVNDRGIPCVESTGVTLTDTAATFSFASHPLFRSNSFSGIIAVKIKDEFTVPATAVPVVFTTAGVPGSNQPVIGYNGEAVTTAEWAGRGIYLFFYDRESNVLQQLTGLPVTAPATATT